VVAAQCTRRALIKGRPEDSIVAVEAGTFRAEGYEVVYEYDEELPGHAVVIPAPKGGRAERIATKTKWILYRDPTSRSFKLRRRIRQAIRNLMRPFAGVFGKRASKQLSDYE
jgi:hypothetical protein